MRKRRQFNPKRKLAPPAPVSFPASRMCGEVRNRGNPEHRSNPGDFGLTPPSQPRRDKTLCDMAGIFRRADAESLLREGFRRGMVSQQVRDNWPQNVWAVTVDRVPLEGQHEGGGVYHGYPMPEADPIRPAILKEWFRRGTP